MPGIWDLSSPTRDWPSPLSWECSLNHSEKSLCYAWIIDWRGLLLLTAATLPPALSKDQLYIFPWWQLSLLMQWHLRLTWNPTPSYQPSSGLLENTESWARWTMGLPHRAVLIMFSLHTLFFFSSYALCFCFDCYFQKPSVHLTYSMTNKTVIDYNRLAEVVNRLLSLPPAFLFHLFLPPCLHLCRVRFWLIVLYARTVSGKRIFKPSTLFI